MRFYHRLHFLPLLLLFYLVYLCSAASGGHVPANCSLHPDCVTLKVIQHHTSPSKLDQLWDAPRSYCDWEGVGCTALGRVCILKVAGMELKGPIPLAVAKLSQLAVLNLSNNLLTGGVPASLLPAMSQLQRLDLSHNPRLGNGSAGLPPAFPPHLTHLSLENCGFSGSIPDSISHLDSLVSLRLGHNLLSGHIPGGFAHLLFLEELSLCDNRLSGSIPDALGEMPAPLRLLDLSSNSLQGPIPTSLGNLTFVEGGAISLARNALTGGMPELEKWWQLSRLDLERNNLDGPIPADLAQLIAFGELQELRLSHNAFTHGLALDALADCSSAQLRAKQECCGLRELWLDGNELEGAVPSQLFLCTSLTTLSLRHTRFSGKLPAALTSLPALTYLDFSFNRLSGAVTDAWIANLGSLQKLFLGHNSFSGSIPASLGELKSLQLLQLSSNKLQGSIPAALAMCNLTFVSLSSNRLTGPIPAALGELNHLQFLDLSANMLGGSIPQDIFSSLTSHVGAGEDDDDSCMMSLMGREVHEYLPLTQNIRHFLAGDLCVPGLIADLSYNDLTGSIPDLDKAKLAYLDLSRNRLSGGFPSGFMTLPWLSHLDVSWNFLDGLIPVGALQMRNLSYLNLDCNHFQNAQQAARFLAPKTAIHDRDTCSWTPHSHHPLLLLWLLLPVPAATALLLLLLQKKKKTTRATTSAEESTQFYILFDREAQEEDRSMMDMVAATNNFSPANIVGDGGFGIVYKACLPNGRVVAVKKLHTGGLQGEREFEAEIRTVGRIRHRNLVELQGYCRFQEERLLLYAFMDNGCLDWWLHVAEKGLHWERRARIAQGAAAGLAFLHHNLMPRVIHRDIKSSNILLDAAFRPHIADFGLARILKPPASQISTAAAGTAGYMAPECVHTSVSTLQMDVYSFGVVLLELLTARRANVQVLPGVGSLASWVRLVVASQGAAFRVSHVLDPSLKSAMNPLQYHQAQQLLSLACRCTHLNPDHRPTMHSVSYSIDSLLHPRL